MCACLELGETALPGKKGVLAVLCSLALCVHTQARTYPQSAGLFFVFFFPLPFLFELAQAEMQLNALLSHDLRCANMLTH